MCAVFESKLPFISIQPNSYKMSTNLDIGLSVSRGRQNSVWTNGIGRKHFKNSYKSLKRETGRSHKFIQGTDNRVNLYKLITQWGMCIQCWISWILIMYARRFLFERVKNIEKPGATSETQKAKDWDACFTSCWQRDFHFSNLWSSRMMRGVETLRKEFFSSKSDTTWIKRWMSIYLRFLCDKHKRQKLHLFGIIAFRSELHEGTSEPGPPAFESVNNTFNYYIFLRYKNFENSRK